MGRKGMLVGIWETNGGQDAGWLGAVEKWACFFFGAVIVLLNGICLVLIVMHFSDPFFDFR